MSKENKNFKCPECGGDISVWADLDAKVTFKVSSKGKLVRRGIENVFQTDGRSGAECTVCDWEITHLDNISEYPHLESLADEALAYQHQVRFLTIKSKGVDK